jgi:NitT/TauT family transport system substrate-binding protein
LLAPGGMYRNDRPVVTVLSQAASTNYTSGKDLAGKTVSTPGSKDLGQLAVEAWIEKTGGDIKTVHFVHRLQMTKLAQYYAQGKIDAGEISEPVWTLERSRGRVKLLGDTFAAIAPRLLIGGYVTTKAWAAAHPAAVKEFVAAMHETEVWANAHHAQTAPLLAKRLHVDPAVVAHMVRATYAPALSPDLIQPVLDAAAKYGLLKPMQTAELVSR